jgi:CDP-6-deoxy-D-xylo-4-hexulose-3-dehydrase
VLNRGQNLDDPFFEAYRFVVPGYNVRPLELAGAVGREQLKKLDSMVAIRRQNAARFVELFKDDPRFIIQREHGSSSWFSFTIILNPGMDLDRAALMDALRTADIQFRMITGGCFPEHAAVKFFDYDIVGNIPNARIAHERGFFVGNHPRDLTDELNHLHQVLNGV